MLTCLLGGLAGTFNAETGDMGGIYMQAIDVNSMTSVADYQNDVRTFLDVIKSTPSAAGFDEVLVPGDYESRNRAERIKNGIEIPDTIYEQLHECAEKLGVSIGEEIVGTEDIERY